MNEIFETLKNLISKLLNNDNYISLISIIVVAFTTYRVTKYTTTKPNRLAIKQSQLEKVYLPLFKIFETVNMPSNIEEAKNCLEKMSKILDENYILVFPQLHSLCRDLSSNIAKDSDFNKTLRIIKHQVDTEYELLKRALGYPSEKFHDIFIRMTKKQKLTKILSWIENSWAFFATFSGSILAIILDLNGTWKYVVLMAPIFISPAIIISLRKYIRSLKD